MRASTLNAVMKSITEGSISRADAAERLGVSERTVNRLMRARGVERPRSPIHAERLDAAQRRALKEAAAHAVVAGEGSHEAAAEAAGCSVRTIYRWISRLERQKTTRKRRKTPGKR
jgi:transposase